MLKSKLSSWMAFIIAILIINSSVEGAKIYDPAIIYLTWQRAPDTTMTILWITEAERDADIVYYQRFGDSRWKQGCGTHSPLPEGHGEMLLHTVELTGLKPNTAYRFRTGSDAVVHSFVTMPAELKSPFRFIVGGDVYHDSIEPVIESIHQAALFSPVFMLLGGDIAYAASKDTKQPEKWERWSDFLKVWKEHMVTPEGHMVPILPTTSNEDTKGRYNQPPENAPFFFALFPTPGLPGYKVIDFADYMSIWLLDTGHINPIDGVQSHWLYKTMEERQAVPRKIAVYHVSSYPAKRPLDNKESPHIRAYWHPIFEKFGLEVAFEHHDHAYKRTHLIRDNKVDPRGVLYIGDGGFGVTTPRIPKKPEDTWYLAKSAAKRHFIVATIGNGEDNFRAIDSTGFVFDEVNRKVGLN